MICNRVNREDNAFTATCHNRLDPISRFADKVNEAERRHFVQGAGVASSTFRHSSLRIDILSYTHLSQAIPAITSLSNNVLLTYQTGIYFPREMFDNVSWRKLFLFFFYIISTSFLILFILGFDYLLIHDREI